MWGHFVAPTKAINQWSLDWIYRKSKWESKRDQRNEAKDQLRYLRKHYGTKVAREYQGYLIYIGVYPLKSWRGKP